MGLTELAFQNLLSPMVLFFVVGLAAALAKSDLTVPEAVAKLLSLYLLMSIGFRGGVEVAHHGMSWDLVAAICAGVLLSYFTPILAYLLLTRMSRLSPVDAAAVAGHYGSISAVTFAAVTGALNLVSLPFAGYMVAVAAAMETPAIVSALQLARPHRKTETADGHSMWREVMLNGSVVTLLGAFVVGMITGPKGLATVKPFLVDLFPGFLCVFLLDMGLIAGRGLQHGRKYLSVPLCSFAVLMPLIGAALGALLASAIGLSAGSAAVLMTLAASASYIAVPAALRLALPEANAAIPLTLSLGITFPFNLLVGIPLYIGAATMLAGAVK
ncbi:MULTISPECIES: sodium-dependent bicarbonate transport family permease [unclassified Bradyrhizobium]|uniref:sodium-dependent bicarbonate transport family permease n=1 Tax=unclassified Bradyrhizobium TaxID=2631580 RepID=UPI0028ED3DB0|nr:MULTISPECIES: sodium-dependent bicarbonate transport family permease [unclassified Bradyrhizobium]